MINPFLDVDGEEAGAVEEELLAIRDVISWDQVQKILSGYLTAKESLRFLSSIVEYGEDLFHCLPNVIFSGKGLQCSRLSSFKAKKQTKYLWTWGSTTSFEWVPVWCRETDIPSPSTTISLSMKLPLKLYYLVRCWFPFHTSDIAKTAKWVNSLN